MVDKTHNRSKILEQLLCWNELFVDFIFYLGVADFIVRLVIVFIVNVKKQ